MNVELICLSALQEQPASGYDIHRRVTGSELSYFASASQASIYTALGRLEARGDVTSRILATPGKPDRIEYSITPGGTRHLADVLAEPFAPDRFSSAFLFFMSLADRMPHAVVLAHLEARQAELEQVIADVRNRTRSIDCASARGWLLGYMEESLQHLRNAIVTRRTALASRLDCDM